MNLASNEIKVDETSFNLLFASYQNDTHKNTQDVFIKTRMKIDIDYKVWNISIFMRIYMTNGHQ